MDKGFVLDHFPLFKAAAAVLGAHLWWMVRRIVGQFDRMQKRLDAHETRIVVIETVCKLRGEKGECGP